MLRARWVEIDRIGTYETRVMQALADAHTFRLTRAGNVRWGQAPADVDFEAARLIRDARERSPRMAREMQRVTRWFAEPYRVVDHGQHGRI